MLDTREPLAVSQPVMDTRSNVFQRHVKTPEKQVNTSKAKETAVDFEYNTHLIEVQMQNSSSSKQNLSDKEVVS